MYRKIFSVLVLDMLVACSALAQTTQKKAQAPELQSAAELADSMAQHLTNDLRVKPIVGEPIKVGSVTLIPILMIDVNFGSGGMTAPPAQTAALKSPIPPADGFFMSGEARPLGFVAITKKGTRFISISKPPAK